LAKHAGKLESFTSDGVALSGADLAKCNAAAKGRTSTSLARAN
jgi:hypothetical protein